MTLLAAAVVLVFGTVTGFQLLTSRADTVDPVPTCTNTTVKDGEVLNSNLVTINVFNASTRSGLANRATIDLQANGFLGGEIGNSDSATKPSRVAILTDDPKDPRVRLVAKQFKDKVKYAEPDIAVEDGVVVIVGNKYSGLDSKASTKVTSDRTIQACVPVVLP
ncbi:LytR C-terminal domain-containing protein [Aeromicrobium sp. A1-2]|uniref:LytR C-terminal domain-containing protein n=1 Tax=Aeromicrobium sp. A1-2 TaxID=2107713 RepID=UPI0013C35654|nr:LytR C-terminal domain-containing protein [Aeromicrobium sp. A1-2]